MGMKVRYMQLLMDELREVWEPGVIAYDHSMLFAKRHFTSRVGLITTIADYPGVGLLPGYAH